MRVFIGQILFTVYKSVNFFPGSFVARAPPNTSNIDRAHASLTQGWWPQSTQAHSTPLHGHQYFTHICELKFFGSMSERCDSKLLADAGTSVPRCKESWLRPSVAAGDNPGGQKTLLHRTQTLFRIKKGRGEEASK